MATWAALDIDTYRRLLGGHMGHIRYRYIQETLWVSTWAAIGVDSYRRLLDGHMDRIRIDASRRLFDAMWSAHLAGSRRSEPGLESDPGVTKRDVF